MESAAFRAAMADRQRGLVVDDDSSGRTLLMAFGGIASQLDGIPPFEFLATLNDHDVRRIFVRDLDQCWYHRGVRGLSSNLTETTAALRSIVADAAPDRLVTLGTSAGGFAAIYFACRLGADRALAFGPQTFTSTRLRWWHRDRRWSEQIAAIDALDPASACRDLRPLVASTAKTRPATRIEIHYGSRTRIDQVHARRLRRVPNVELHAHDCEHNVAKAMRDNGELPGVLTRAVTGSP